MKKIIRFIVPGPKRIVFFLLILLGVQLYSLKYPLNMWITNLQVRETVMMKDNHKVILLPMSHIGNEEFYQYIGDKYKNEKDMIVLLEGVRITEDSPKIDHSSMAEMLGLAMQKKNTFNNYNTVNADVSMDNFSEETNKFVTIAMNFYDNLKNKGWFFAEEQIRKDQEEMGISEVDVENVKYEIVEKRNIYLLSQLKKYNEDYNTILIPWGALHISGIKSSLEKGGYKEASSEQIKVFNWVSAIFSFISYQINN